MSQLLSKTLNIATHLVLLSNPRVQRGPPKKSHRARLGRHGNDPKCRLQIKLNGTVISSFLGVNGLGAGIRVFFHKVFGRVARLCGKKTSAVRLLPVIGPWLAGASWRTPSTATPDGGCSRRPGRLPPLSGWRVAKWQSLAACKSNVGKHLCEAAMLAEHVVFLPKLVA